MDRKEAMAGARRESHKNSGKVLIVAIRGDSEKIGGKKSVHKLSNPKVRSTPMFGFVDVASKETLI